ncbi:MAG: hypothetical protein UW16_C0002G0005 [Microgenomates group bacterium GW2011_GWC1_44_10]|nr:MAG: hypothetical protein UW16_C0002G0005 [Microgenomates group bacterium GW2011_GWC1_44_10]
MTEFHLGLRKAADNASKEGRLQTVGAHEDSIYFALSYKGGCIILGNGASIKNGGCVICQESNLTGNMIGVNRVDWFSCSDSRDGFVNEETSGNIDIKIEQGLNLFVQVGEIQTDNGGDGVFQKQTGLLGNNFRGFLEVTASFGVAYYTVAHQFAKHVGGNLTSVFAWRKMRNILGAGDDW